MLELQTALQEALETIKEYERNPPVKEVIVEVAAAAVAPSPAQEEAPHHEDRGNHSIRDQESRTTQTEVPAGPTRVQLLVKIAIIGTKLTHR